MSYQTELNFTVRALERMRLQVTLVRPGVSLKQLDYGLRAILGLDLLNYEKLVSESLFWVKQGKIYKLMDQFLCNYIFFLLILQFTTSFFSYAFTDEKNKSLLAVMRF